MHKERGVPYLKQLLFIIAFALVSGSQAWATPCGVASLTTYLGSGFSCSIGGDTFSNFSYTASGSVTVAASSITVTPVDNNLGPGLMFSNAWGVNTGQTEDSLIGFEVNTGGPATIEDASVIQTSSGFLGTGEVLVTEGLCLGGTTPPCPDGQTNLLTSNEVGNIQLFSEAFFTPTGVVEASKDISLIGGTDGTAAASAITDQFSTVVPEPASLGLFGIGLLGLAFAYRRRLKAIA